MDPSNPTGSAGTCIVLRLPLASLITTPHYAISPFPAAETPRVGLEGTGKGLGSVGILFGVTRPSPFDGSPAG